MCWGAGILLSSGVVRAVASIDGDLGWRLPFALQFIWPIPLAIGAYFAPESPWNCVRRGKFEEARASLMRLRQETPEKAKEVDAGLAYIKYTTELERAETENASFIECFKGTNLRRTEIVSWSFVNPPLVSLTDSFINRTALSGQLRFFAAMPSLDTQSCFSKRPAFPNFKRSTSTSHFPPAILLVVLFVG